MKKVLMLSSTASMIDQFNMENIDILQEQGYEIQVAANFDEGNTTSKERVEQFKQELKEKNILYFQTDFSRNVTNIAKHIKAYKQIKKILKDNNYEFIHCHSPIGGVCGRLAAKFTNTKVIYTAHGFHFYKGAPKLNWMIYYPIEKALSYITDVLITINKEDYELAKKRMKAKKIEYVPGVGVDTNKFNKVILDKVNKRKELGLGKDNIVLLSVGELSKRKNHEVVIRALSKIDSSNLQYVIVGRGPLDEYITNLVKELGLEDKVRLLGFRRDIVELCKMADIFLFPSIQEGLPVALMEAMACNLPVICSDTRGNNDLIKEEIGGYLCSPKDIDKFAYLLNILIKDKELRYNFGNYNAKLIEKYDIKVVNSKMEKIYLSILDSEDTLTVAIV